MTVQHIDIFHCLKCGRLVYQNHNAQCPNCCEEAMVRAVSDVESAPDDVRPRAVPAKTREKLRAMQIEHRLLLHQAAAPLTRWNQIDVPSLDDFEETRTRLGALRDQLAAHFDEEERNGYLAEALAAAPRFSTRADQLCQEHKNFLAELDRLRRCLRADEPESWKEARSDFEQLVANIRKHEGSENAIVQAAFGDDVGAAD